VDARLDIDTSIVWPSATIPALTPHGLGTVPGFRLKKGKTIPTGWRPTPGEPNPYEDPRWRTEHKAWTRKLLEVRPGIHARGRKDAGFARVERALCAQDPNYFGAVYGWLFDPKPMAGETMHKPFAKFAYQCHNTTAQQRIIALPERAWLWRPKSRQLGISWDDEHFDLWFYLWGEGQAKLFSRSEKWVYNGSSTEAMMGKMLYVMKKIEESSPYLLPEGYSVERLWRSPALPRPGADQPHHRHRPHRGVDHQEGRPRRHLHLRPPGRVRPHHGSGRRPHLRRPGHPPRLPGRHRKPRKRG
jgi:hypothetical protein